MPKWLRNVGVQPWLVVIIGGTLASIFMALVHNPLPDVWWWPYAWLAAYFALAFVLAWRDRNRYRRAR